MNQYAGTEDFDQKKLRRLQKSDAADRKLNYWAKMSTHQDSSSVTEPTLDASRFQDVDMAEVGNHKMQDIEEAKGQSISISEVSMAEPPVAAPTRQWKSIREEEEPQSVAEFKRRQYQKSKIERAMELDR